MKKLIFFTLLALPLSIIKLEAKNMIIKHPTIFADIAAKSCEYNIKVNDISIAQDNLGIPFSIQYPLNQWIKSGDNELSITILPTHNAKALTQSAQTCNINIMLSIKNRKNDSKKTLIGGIKYTSKPDNISDTPKHLIGTTPIGELDSKQNYRHVEKNGDVILGPVSIEKIETKNGPGVKITRTIHLPKLPFPQWAWFSGEQIPNNDQTKTALLTQYKKIWQALYAKKIQTLQPEFSQRIKEYSEAFYLPEKEVNVVSTLEKAQSSSKQTLVPINEKFANLKIFGNGKLAQLVSWDHKTSIIVFNAKNGKSYDSYDIIFMKKNGQWEIIR